MHDHMAQRSASSRNAEAAVHKSKGRFCLYIVARFQTRALPPCPLWVYRKCSASESRSRCHSFLSNISSNYIAEDEQVEHESKFHINAIHTGLSSIGLSSIAFSTASSKWTCEGWNRSKTTDYKEQYEATRTTTEKVTKYAMPALCRHISASVSRSSGASTGIKISPVCSSMALHDW